MGNKRVDYANKDVYLESEEQRASRLNSQPYFLGTIVIVLESERVFEVVEENMLGFKRLEDKKTGETFVTHVSVLLFNESFGSIIRR